ncbi:riboflavin synthase, partial [Staphylococcus aureus]|nr:riboflavin synthase [Staphylococcus aureus]
MFTGIVEEIGVVKSVQIRQSVRTIEIEAHKS